ncbi:Chrdl2 [Columba guinea]|nr:Chrdl2 [Columba guinea]
MGLFSRTLVLPLAKELVHGVSFRLARLCAHRISLEAMAFQQGYDRILLELHKGLRNALGIQEPHSPSGLRAPVKSCQYNGTTYQQGEMFTTSELFPSRQPNQCVQCSCSEGQIYCGLVTCPELLCSSPLTMPDSCCQVCKDGSQEKSTEEEPLQLNRGVRHSQDQCSGEAMGRKPPGTTASTILSSSLEFIPRNFKPKGGGGTTVKIVMKERHKKACVYNGKTYSHGEVWHPVFRLYGLLPCILCTCRDGVQDCQKITCPKEYPCNYPEKVDGKCCKICPGGAGSIDAKSSHGVGEVSRSGMEVFTRGDTDEDGGLWSPRFVSL